MIERFKQSSNEEVPPNEILERRESNTGTFKYVSHEYDIRSLNWLSLINFDEENHQV